MPKARTLSHITIGRLELALDDLLSKRLTALTSFPYGAFVAKELTELRDRIAALPAAAKSRPFAGELAELDKRHDGFGAACWFLVEAYLRAPDTTPEQRKTLESIRDVLGILDDITAGYDAEAKAAKDRNAKLPGITAALASFPLADGKTLLDWAQGYVGAGVSIGEVLSNRADGKDRALASALRNDTVGVLNETRRQLARAAKKDASLADLDAQVFSWFDELEKASTEEAAAAKKKPTSGAAPSPAEPVTPAPAPDATPGDGTGG